MADRFCDVGNENPFGETRPPNTVDTDVDLELTNMQHGSHVTMSVSIFLNWKDVGKKIHCFFTSKCPSAIY